MSSTHIKNTACAVGNFVHAGAVTDMSNCLLATDVVLIVIDAKTGKKIKMDMTKFFAGYRKTKLNQTDVVVDVSVPLTSENQHVFCYKQAHRRDDDICIVPRA